MSYHRGDPYCWDDGEDIHIWSNVPENPVGWKNGVKINCRVFDEIVIRRFGTMVREGRVPPAIDRAVKEMGGHFQNDMMKAASKRAKEDGV